MALLPRFPMVVLKRGAKGSLAGLRGIRPIYAPGIAAKTVDTTGAGDAFLAGFVRRWRTGGTIAECLAEGNRHGAEAVARIGGRPSERTGPDMVRIAAVTISDRASAGHYEDRSGPAIADWLKPGDRLGLRTVSRIVPDGIDSVADTFAALADLEAVDLILATGGTGPAPRDLTPEAMARVIDKELPGFGELMRATSLKEVPTAILSRQSAGIRNKTLIVTLPGKPAAIKTCLDAVFPAIPYCLDLIGAGRIETARDVVKAFRPKGA